MLKVERVENVGKQDGKTYNNYYVYGNIRRIDIRIEVVPPDAGGYKVLEIVYNGEKTCELKIVEREFTDNTGKQIKSKSFQVVSQDLDDEGNFKEYVADVMPKRKSDKALLNMLLS